MDDRKSTFGQEIRSNGGADPVRARSAGDGEWMRLLELGDVHVTADNYVSALEFYERARSLLEAMDAPDTDRVLVDLKLADCLYKRGRFLETVTLLQGTLARMGPGADELLRARTLARLGRLENNLGQYAPAQLHCYAAYEVLRGTSANEEIGLLELSLGTIASRLGQMAKARDHFESALFTFRRIDSREGISKALNNLGLLLKNGPRWAEARDYLTRALAVSEEEGNYARVASHCLNLGILFTKSIEWTLAQQHLNRALTIFRETGNNDGQAKTQIALGTLKLRLRQERLAETHYRSALELARQHGYLREEALALEFLGELHLQLGESEQARGHLLAALELARRVAPEGDVVPEVLRRLAELALLSGRVVEAVRCATEAIWIAHQLGDAIETGSALRVLALAHAEAGRLDAAVQYLNSAELILRQTPDALAEARCRRARIELLRVQAALEGSSAQRQGFVREAGQIADELWPRFVDMALPGLALDVLYADASLRAALGDLDDAFVAVGRGLELAEQVSASVWLERFEELRADLEERFAEGALSRSAEYQLLQEMSGFSPWDSEATALEFLRLACERSSSDRALVAWSAEGQRAQVEASLGFVGSEVLDSAGLLDTLLGDFRNGRRVHVVHASGIDPRHASCSRDRQHVASAVAIPIPLNDGSVGLLYIDRLTTNSAGSLRNSDLRLLSIFAGWLSVLLNARERERRRASMDAQTPVNEPFAAYVTCNSELKRTLALLRRLNDSDVTVLITGETGTGKGLIARLVHAASSRSAGGFVPVNCAALPETLLESELFGHLQGAFTGAIRSKRGLFEEAEQGTLFLDEIDKAPLGVQAKLLHVLDRHEIRSLGDTKWRTVNVRVLCATNVDLKRAIFDGRFLEDLYYRLNDFQVHLPPLRDRREDIPLLIRRFYQQFSAELGRRPLGISRDVLQSLTDHEWRGNVRELEKVIKRMLVLADDGEMIGPDLLPREIATPATSPSADAPRGTLRVEIQRLEARMIADALVKAHGNKSEAARRLHLSYPSLLAKIKQYALEPRTPVTR